MKNKIIEAENLTKIYKKSVKAVDDISFTVDEGELFGFLGRPIFVTKSLNKNSSRTGVYKSINQTYKIRDGNSYLAIPNYD